MTIHTLFNDQLTVRRLKTVSGSRKRYQATATVWGDIRELDTEVAEALGLHPSRAFRIYTDWADNVKAGDRIDWKQDQHFDTTYTQTTRKFLVKNVNIRKDWLAEHKELICEELLE